LQHSLVKYYINITEAVPGSFQYEYTDNTTGEILLKSIQVFTTKEEAETEAELIELLALENSNYKAEQKANTKFELRLFDKLNVQQAASVKEFNTKNQALAYIENIKALALNSSEEGMFIIENHLLLPQPGEDVFMNICVDDDCEDCKNHDPYSFHISILLPAYAGRFNDINYRQYAEQVLRSETPTHIMPKVCWLNNECMKALEDAWKNWLHVLNGADVTNRNEKLQTLITVLQTCKTIYPKARLQDCSSLQEKKLLILNQSSLGTIKTS
jgi:uncharacterized protein